MQTAPLPGADWVVILPAVLPLLSAALLVMLRGTRDLLSVFALIVAAATLYCVSELLRRVLEDGPLAMTMGGWLPPFGISFTADLMEVGFALLASIVTLAVLVAALSERRPGDGRDGFHAFVLLLLAGTNGAFLTGDLFNLYVWFEVMLIASFGLLVTGGRPIQLDATVKYGVLNFIGTSLFLLAVGLLYGTTGTLNMADIARVAPSADPAVVASIAAVLLLAFGIKAAAFPVNAWLPAAYHVPPAVIGALLVGLATKVGVYALLRTMLAILPVARDLLEPVLVVAAAATLVVAPLGALAETNLRRALGFVVIGGIGAALSGLAVGGAAGASGAIVYLAHAMLTLVALYLVAGLIEGATGETQWPRMAGLYRGAPELAVLFLVLVLAASGVPPFLGFWPKLMLIEAALAPVGESGAGWHNPVLAAALLLNALLTLVAGTRFWSHIFWRTQREDGAEPPPVQPRPRLALGAAAGLTLMVVVLGLWPEPLVGIATTAAVDLLDGHRYTEAVFPGAAP